MLYIVMYYISCVTQLYIHIRIHPQNSYVSLYIILNYDMCFKNNFLSSRRKNNWGDLPYIEGWGKGGDISSKTHRVKEMRRRMTSSGSGSKMQIAPEEEESAWTIYWPLSKSFLLLLHFSIFFPFLWAFLDYWSRSLSSFESKDPWRCLPAMSSLFQTFLLKSRVI